MTGASENGYLVRLRAQVMYHDEGTGGWMALSGGGLADVVVGKRPAPPPNTAGSCSSSSNEATPSAPSPAPAHEYYIHGKRISDSMVVLDCTIKKDFMYNKVMPTFHHWVTDEKRFGLTFQTAADARAFDKGVRIAVEQLLNDLRATWPSTYDGDKHYLVTIEEEDEHDIFECLELPGDTLSLPSRRKGGYTPKHPASPAKGAATGAHRRPAPGDITQTPILSAITLPKHPLSETMKQYEAQYEEKVSNDDDDQDKPRYVHLSAVHEYTYPQVGSAGPKEGSEKSSPNTKPPLPKRDSGVTKKRAPPPLLERKVAESFEPKFKCRHCDEWYLQSANRPGSCKYAPDKFRACVDCVSCIKCAQCMLYHCFSDAEGEFTPQPCACTPVDRACAKRWFGVAALSLFVPCLWCYVPLRCAHKAACAVKLAGGVHAPICR